MSYELVPRPSMAPTTRMPRAQRAVVRAIEYERGQTAIAAARVNRIALTARVGLQRVAELSEMETQLIKMAPLGEARYAAIVDEATMAFASVIQRQGLDILGAAGMTSFLLILAVVTLLALGLLLIWAAMEPVPGSPAQRQVDDTSRTLEDLDELDTITLPAHQRMLEAALEAFEEEHHERRD